MKAFTRTDTLKNIKKDQLEEYQKSSKKDKSKFWAPI